jgi:hypothetical protein
MGLDLPADGSKNIDGLKTACQPAQIASSKLSNPRHSSLHTKEAATAACSILSSKVAAD